ncbi:MAG: peptidoglycan DD-metalloendopeptidase family protein [Campylobacterota bacterium]|nr:peptidoglycan DD-metalloendopeptidase family protein [Campylobacterota bacterium]
MRYIFLLLLPLLLWSATVENLRWQNGESFLMFLTRVQLPDSIYYQADKEDQTLVEEIMSRVNYQILRDDNDAIEQILIPITDESQIHIFKKNEEYALEIIPIIYETKREAFTIEVQNSPHYDIYKQTGSSSLAHAFVNGFKNSLNFKTDLRKNDPIVMIYDQKYRLGKPFSMPDLQAAMVQMRGKKHYIYLNSDSDYYDEKGERVEGFLLARPVGNARISSRFTKRRWHPVLKKYRAHLGVDYAAPRGTPIRAAGSGKVVHAGYSRGYGNYIKVAHSDGYLTLYAHQKAFKRGIKRGKRVKKGQVIGYVGSTGISTGPHLHFGLYKNGRAINPLRVVKVTSKKLRGKQKTAFNKLRKNVNETIELHLAAKTPAQKRVNFENYCMVNKSTCKAVDADT